MNPKLEKVPLRPGMSWRYQKMDLAALNKTKHYHNEFEIALHVGKKGELQVGQQQINVTSLSLFLLPPKTPHSYHCIDTLCTDESISHIIWFTSDWVANMTYSCPEFRKVHDKLQSAGYGVKFSEQSAQKVHRLISTLDCEDTKLNQLALLIEILSILCVDKNTSPLLSSSHYIFNENNQPQSKVNRLARYLEDNFNQPITLKDVAHHMCLSSSSVHRLFLHHFGETFNQRLQKIRLSHAAQWLTESSTSIASISLHSGYQNQANFNRKFKQYKGVTPSEYRKKFSTQK